MEHGGHSPHGDQGSGPAAGESHAAHAGTGHGAGGHGEHGAGREQHSGGLTTGDSHAAHDGMGHAAGGHGEHHAGHEQHSSGDAGAHHVDHSGHEEMFRRRFWVCLALTAPVLLYNPMLQMWVGFSMPDFAGSRWLTPALAVVIFLYGGLPFLRMAAPEVQTRQPGMMTLISMAITVAFGYSLASLFIPSAQDFFWELATLIDIMLLGHWIEMRSVRQASRALDELAKLMPDTAERVRPDGSIETTPASALRGGDLLLIRPGASVPADGIVVDGESDVDEAMITGESRPITKAPDAKVIAGTINGGGSLRVRVTATGDQTALAGIMRLVRQAQMSKSRVQVLADRAAGWLFYAALAVAVLTGVAWTLAVGFDVEVVKRVATVLVIACPHALGLAIPLVVAITTSLASRGGILVRDRLALEAARRVDVVMFDKTGTLTEGRQGLVGLEAAAGWEEKTALALMAAIEGDSEHMIARGVRQAAVERGLSLPAVGGFEALKGRGVRAHSDGRTVYVGGPRLLELLSLAPGELHSFAASAGRKGQTVVYLVADGRVAAAAALADVIRPESRPAVERLHGLGIEVAMLTGDSVAVAQAVAAELDIDHVFAEVLPADKDQKVVELQRQGKRVAMVGDGVNDAPALTRADVGIAIGSGTDVAVESAGVILVNSDPLDVVKTIELSRASYRKMVQNLIWAAGYNVVALPLAAGVLAPIGIILSPAVGALLMSLSTIIVALNAQLLRRASLS